mmetsp:Transcript_46784/g.113976  ORF Transcript_46784/g.113976 Transcript_46784/m.113976 type:complete len:318 (+) Transcript_46784:2121-3074(+)
MVAKEGRHDAAREGLDILEVVLLVDRDTKRVHGLPKLLRLLPHPLREHLVHGLEQEVHKRTAPPAGRGRLLKLARTLIKPKVTPQALGELGGGEGVGVRVRVDACELLEREGEPEERRGERDGAVLGREGRCVRRVGRNEAVHLLNHVLQLEVGVLGRELELEDEPVDLVDNERDGLLLEACHLDHAIRVEHHPLHSINHQQKPVAYTHRGAHLVDEVDVPRGIHKGNGIRLPLAIRQQQRDRHRLDAKLALLLVDARVKEPQVLAHVPLLLERALDHLPKVVRLPHKAVHEAGLPRVQVPRHAHIAHKLRIPTQAL